MKIYDKLVRRNNHFYSDLYDSSVLSAPHHTPSSQNPDFIKVFKAALKIVFAALLIGITGYFFMQKIGGPSALNKNKVVVAVSQFVEHPALNAVRDGIKDTLKAAGYDPGENLGWVYQNAHGNMSANTQIAHKFAGLQPTIIIAISSPSAQAAVRAAENTSIPVVFTAVTDPLGAGLVSNLEKPGKNITGVSDFPPLRAQLVQIRKILPQAHKLGVVYNPGESNSVTIVNLLRKEAPQEGFSLVEAAATKTSDVGMAVQSIIDDVDALLIPPDNTLISVINQVVKIGFERHKAVFTVDTQSVYHGALASVGFSYYETGQYTGQIVISILQGKEPGGIPIKSPANRDIFLNLASAEKLGIPIPADIVDKAKYVIREGEGQ